MINTIQYACECCGKIHDKWPALTYFSPSNYDYLTDNDKKLSAKLIEISVLSNIQNKLTNLYDAL